MIQLSNWSKTVELCEETDAQSNQRATRESLLPSWKKGLHSWIEFLSVPSSNEALLTAL